MNNLKLKLCKICLQEFQPIKPLQVSCSYKCALDYARGKIAKKVKAENKVKKERMKTKSQHLKELQVIFNKYIRTRDLLLPCVSCGDSINGTPHASHFFSVGSHPALRFNPHNVHSSCSQCNTHLHGNLVEYSLRLPDRIGQDNYDKLIASRGDRLQLSIPEIELLKTIYKNKIKDLL
jgi:hypothetical protein